MERYCIPQKYKELIDDIRVPDPQLLNLTAKEAFNIYYYEQLKPEKKESLENNYFSTLIKYYLWIKHKNYSPSKVKRQLQCIIRCFHEIHGDLVIIR